MSTGAGSKEEQEGCVPPLASGGATQLLWKPPALLCMYLVNTRASNHYSCPRLRLHTRCCAQHSSHISPTCSPQPHHEVGTNISPIFR